MQSEQQQQQYQPNRMIFQEENPIIKIVPVGETKQIQHSPTQMESNKPIVQKAPIQEDIEKKVPTIHSVETEKMQPEIDRKSSGEEQKIPHVHLSLNERTNFYQTFPQPDEKKPESQQINEVEQDTGDNLKEQFKKIAERELPSITQIRQVSEEESNESVKEAQPEREPEPEQEDETVEQEQEDLEFKEWEKPESKPLPTMDQERESTIDEEAQWLKEHKMEPEPEFEHSDEDLRKSEPQEPADKEELISKLQKPMSDRDKPTSVEPKKEDNIDEIMRKYEDLKLKFEENYKQSQQVQQQPNDSEFFDLETLVNYLTEHKQLIEANLGEDDRKRIQVILNIAKDLRSLCKEAIETLKNDLLEFYTIAKNKFTQAINEMNKLASNTSTISSNSQK